MRTGKSLRWPLITVGGAIGGAIAVASGLAQLADFHIGFEWTVAFVAATAAVVSLGGWLRSSAKAVRLVSDEAQTQSEATKLLEKVPRNGSVYYYGGVGFISDSKEWARVYEEKLRDPSIRIVRFLDVKRVDEMRHILAGQEQGRGKPPMTENQIEAEVSRYADGLGDKPGWVKTHCNHLETRKKNNFFYNYVGAPIWKYGIHFIVFDKKHVVIPFVNAQDDTKNAVFIENRPDIARALVRCLNSLAEVLALRDLTGEELAEKAGLSS